MLRRSGRPQTEAIEMFRCKNEAASAGAARGAGPLSGDEPRWIEDAGILAPVTPLPIRVGVDAAMQKERELVTLTIEMRLRRTRAQQRRPLTPAVWQRTRRE